MCCRVTVVGGGGSVAQVAVCRRSEHHDVFIGYQHQLCSHYCLGQETGYCGPATCVSACHCILNCVYVHLETQKYNVARE